MQDLRSKAVSGVRWTGLSTGIVTVLEFTRIAILARLLSTRDFGLMSMLMVVMGFCQAFVDMGMSNAIVQKKEITRSQISSVFWLNIASGAFLFAVLAFSSPWIARFYKEEALGGLIMIIAINLLVIPLGQLPQSLLQKELRFKDLSVIDVRVSLATLFFSTWLALNGFGVFALIFSILFASTVRSGLLLFAVRKTWLPEYRFDIGDIRHFYKFGLFQMGEKAVNYFSANVDYIFVGRFLGADVLGVYTIAYQLVVMPFLKLNPVLTKVAFPVFSIKQDDALALRRGYLELIKLVCFMVFPIVVAIAACAPVFIPLVYGEKWATAVGITQILALIGITKAVGNPSGSVLLAKGRADIGFKWNVLVAVVNTGVFYLAAQQGVMVVAASWAVLSLIYFFLGAWILRSVIGIELRDYFYVILRFISLSGVMGLAMAFCVKITGGLHYNYLFSFLVSAAAGAGVYFLLIYSLEREYLKKILGFLLKRKQA